MQQLDFRKPETERDAMSNEEKACQIGNAVLGLQDAKINLAQLGERFRQVQNACRAVADTKMGGNIRFKNRKIEMPDHPFALASSLMAEPQLAELLELIRKRLVLAGCTWVCSGVTMLYV